MPKPKFSPGNPMPKTFTAIVPLSLEAASETYQFAPAVRIGDQILISGIVGFDAEGRLPPDFRSQAENVFTTLEAILNEAFRLSASTGGALRARASREIFCDTLCT
jgi:enamine deaminase RidA (YjgF/YER057c/UK114 family)